MSSTKFMSAVRYCIISHNYVITRNPLHNGIDNIIPQDYIVNVNNVSSNCLIIYATHEAKFLFFAPTWSIGGIFQRGTRVTARGFAPTRHRESVGKAIFIASVFAQAKLKTSHLLLNEVQ